MLHSLLFRYGDTKFPINIFFPPLWLSNAVLLNLECFIIGICKYQLLNFSLWAIAFAGMQPLISRKYCLRHLTCKLIIIVMAYVSVVFKNIYIILLLCEVFHCEILFQHYSYLFHFNFSHLFRFVYLVIGHFVTIWD